VLVLVYSLDHEQGASAVRRLVPLAAFG